MRRQSLKTLILWLGFMVMTVQASDQRAYEQGLKLADEFKISSEIDLKFLPDYKDPTTFAESINEKNIHSKIQEASTDNKEAEVIGESYLKRPRFDLDPRTDSLFTDADKIVTDPETPLKVKSSTRVLAPGKTEHRCTKGYDLLEHKCRWIKTAVQSGIRQEVKTTQVYVQGKQGFIQYPEIHLEGDTLKRGVTLDPTNILWRSNSREHIVFKKNIKDVFKIAAFKTLFSGRDAVSGHTVSIDTSRLVSVDHVRNHGGRWFEYKTDRREQRREWHAMSDTTLYSEIFHGYPAYLLLEVKHLVDVPTYNLASSNNCDDLEGQADTGACEYSSKRCVEGPETRIIDGTPVYADCWAEEAVYQCRTPETDDCHQWVKRGCVQIGSRCLTLLEAGHCVKWEQTYECTSGKRQAPITGLTGDKPFCLDGSCVDQTWDGNGDMIEALSKLAIFKEMQKSLDPTTSTVFKGRSLGCSRVPAGFKDCCQIKGWGRNISLASCNTEEEDLSQQRKLDKCLLIGTYCADRVLGVCTRKKTTYCCYTNKLSKIINVQGKRQLRLSFGTAEHPACGGLTLDEIGRMDFSKLDLSELFSEMFANLKTPNPDLLNRSIQTSMANKTYMVTDKKENITQGKAHGNF